MDEKEKLNKTKGKRAIVIESLFGTQIRTNKITEAAEMETTLKKGE